MQKVFFGLLGGITMTALIYVTLWLSALIGFNPFILLIGIWGLITMLMMETLEPK